MTRKPSPRTIIVVSDLHCGCRMGLCPAGGAKLDAGGVYKPSRLQRKLWAQWREFCDKWIPHVTKREPFVLVVNGDALDGNHHGSTTQISHNLSDQSEIAVACLADLCRASSSYYHVRGTEAHVGPSGAEEERLARRLGARPGRDGDHAQWELWIDLRGHLCHFTHHIGSTGSSPYEVTAIGKELVEAYVEAGRWGDRPPQVVVRSHRHRYAEIRLCGNRGYAISLTTPAFQLKTPYSYRIAGGRLSPPQIGGIAIRVGDEELYTRSKVWALEREEPEVFRG